LIAYAKLVGRGRGVSLLIAMLIGFGIAFTIALLQVTDPDLLEKRFCSFGSIFFNIASIKSNTDSANSALAGMSPNAVIALFLGIFVQASCCGYRNDDHDNIRYTDLVYRRLVGGQDS
jgi:K+-transporting ATPase ATPase A chain